MNSKQIALDPHGQRLRVDLMSPQALDTLAPEDSLTQADLNAGDWVEVRSKEEILASLDANGQLEGMPFMPEMFAFCGKRLRVYKRAHKTCDTVNDYKGRKLKDAVHLEKVRCDGQAHGGCEAGCLIFWKTAWLRRVPAGTDASRIEKSRAAEPRALVGNGCTEADVFSAAIRRDGNGGDRPAYVCQATRLPAFTEPLSPWELGQYAEDYKSGNTRLGRMAASFVYMFYHHWLVNLGIGIGPPLRWLYDRFQGLWGGTPYPRISGKLPIGTTPTVALNLQPGEWVKVKSRDEILSTCDQNNANRGMKFDAELVPYCGGVYQVLRRITKILNEKTGVMQEMKNPCIILDEVTCQARYSDCRLFCPRAVYPYWREIWLERAEAPAVTGQGDTA